MWVVDLDGWPPGSRALLLREPKSLLFPQWSRRAADCGAPRAYLLLAVDWGKGHWILSTDPFKQLRLGALAELMRKAEAEAGSTGAAKRSWEERFDGTMVLHRRSKLSNERVISLLKQWTHASDPPPSEPLAPRRSRPSWAYAVVGLLALAGCLGAVMLVREVANLFNQMEIQIADAKAPQTAADKGASDVDNLKNALAREQASVYLVREKDSAGNESYATAWVVKRGNEKVLVTCAHAAENFDRSQPGRLTVTASGGSATPLTITSADPHPGCQAWIKLWQETNQGGGKPPYYFCDVALLHVSDDDQATLSADLPLASQSTLESLRAQDSIGLSGYQIEGVTYQQSQTRLYNRDGEVADLTDFFRATNSNSAQCLLVEHYIDAAGGTSGGPIINPKGEVIAVQSAANFEAVPGWPWRASRAAPIFYAP